MKNTILAFMVAGILIGAPLAASALSTQDVQSQISSLMEQIKTLQAKIADLVKQQSAPAKPAGIDPVMPEKQHRVCFLLNRNLLQGSTGEDVSGLQEFLNAEGYLSVNATGFFGPMTAQALAKWQTSQGVESVGMVGPMTRERIKIWCGDTVHFAAEPQRGASPLKVMFKSNKFATHDASEPQHYVDFGDGSERGRITCTNFVGPDLGTGRCLEWGVDHTYTSNGTFTAALVRITDPCFGAPRCLAPTEKKVLSSLIIEVGDQIACTKEYNPVCGAKPIVCVTTPCNPIPTTYSNTCAMNADGASYLYAGECKVTPNPADDPKCKSWYDGCNTCSRSTPGGAAMCTLRACMKEMMAKPYCTAYFDSSTNKPPVISSFSGPTTLSINQTGTWTVGANDPENGQLNYQVTWGDEQKYAMGMNASSQLSDTFVQMTTFTHAYATVGTYTVTIVVRDASGQVAKSSSTVKVGSEGTICTMEYAPVCGQPSGCANTCPPGMYCALMCQQPIPQTYSNKCMMRAAGATLINEGTCTDPITPVACTSDAMQCPNGTYVGRTGPNCQFVCPTTTVTSCPQYQMPLCPNGTVVNGPANANGCPGAPICQAN